MIALPQAAPSPAPFATAAPAAARPEPAPSPVVASTPSAQIAARARLVFEQVRANAVDHAQFTSGMDAKLDPRGLAQAAGELRALGAVTSFNQTRRISHGSASVYVFRIVCEHGPPVEEAIGFAPDGKVDYLSFHPVTPPPSPAPAVPPPAPAMPAPSPRPR